MTTRSMVTALTFGFLVFTPLPMTALADECANVCGRTCPAGYETRVRAKGVLKHCGGGEYTVCCAAQPVTKTAPPNPCEAEGPEYDEYKRKHCGKKASTTTPSRDPARNCSPGQRYDYAAKRCFDRPVHNIGKAKTTDDTPAALKPVRACRAKGPEYEYDVQAGVCVQKAEEPRKKKKKRKQHNDDDDDDD